MNNFLVRVIGFPATLIHGDTMVLDRWRWIKKRLPLARANETMIDVGCGSGAFTHGAAKLGYRSIGLTWNELEQAKASERISLLNTTEASFEVCDVRRLDTVEAFQGKFDVAICCENIEHILDDKKLIRDIANVLKPGGSLPLTTPYLHFRPIGNEDTGIFLPIEDGGHVRRGYSEEMLRELCEVAGLEVVEVSYCSGLLSQKFTGLLRRLSAISYPFAWLVVLPLRLLPPLLDTLLSRLTGWPDYSICLVALKPSQIGRA